MSTGFGICRLALVPVRSGAGDRNEQVTQLLFGEHYQVLEYSENRRWIRIRIFQDGYVGWIDLKQHFPVSEEFYQELSNSTYKISLELVSKILLKKHYINILLGSILPVKTRELFQFEQQLDYTGASRSQEQRGDYNMLKEMALKYLGAPYLWGGKSPFGIDCSGLTQMVFRLCGYFLPRDSGEQKLEGKSVENLEQALPGDLAYLQGIASGVPHVGIILENREIIHASGQVRIDLIDEKGIFNRETSQHTHDLKSIRRIIR